MLTTISPVYFYLLSISMSLLGLGVSLREVWVWKEERICLLLRLSSSCDDPSKYLVTESKGLLKTACISAVTTSQGKTVYAPCQVSAFCSSTHMTANMALCSFTSSHIHKLIIKPELCKWFTDTRCIWTSIWIHLEAEGSFVLRCVLIRLWGSRLDQVNLLACSEWEYSSMLQNLVYLYSASPHFKTVLRHFS